MIAGGSVVVGYDSEQNRGSFVSSWIGFGALLGGCSASFAFGLGEEVDDAPDSLSVVRAVDFDSVLGGADGADGAAANKGCWLQRLECRLMAWEVSKHR